MFAALSRHGEQGIKTQSEVKVRSLLGAKHEMFLKSLSDFILPSLLFTCYQKQQRGCYHPSVPPVRAVTC